MRPSELQCGNQLVVLLPFAQLPRLWMQVFGEVQMADVRGIPNRTAVRFPPCSGNLAQGRSGAPETAQGAWAKGMGRRGTVGSVEQSPLG